MSTSDRVNYGEFDVRRVADVMHNLHAGPENAAPIAQIVRECGLNERVVRAILADFDGVAVLLGENDRGRFLATTAEQAEAMTARLKARAATELGRVARREAFVSAMKVRPVEQLGLGIAS